MSDAEQKLFLIGHPIAHSKSPVLYDAAYRALGLDWPYELVDCENEAEARAFLHGGAWLAVNVTMPWKHLALQVAEAVGDVHISLAAHVADGANLLVNHDGVLFADNVDGKGCVAYLERCGAQVAGTHVAVCGTGPTARAIAHACAEASSSDIALFSRDALRARQAAEFLKRHVGAPVNGYVYNDQAARAALGQADIIVDATPLGMQVGDPAPFDTVLLSSDQTVLDVVYGHGETQLLADARKIGCRAFDGSGMLVAQAVETVRAISHNTGAFDIPESLDLFQVMSDALGD